jgi:signal peptidase I
MQTADDPGDLAPAGIGTEGAAFSVRSLRVLRDVYYIASNGGDEDYKYEEGQADLTKIFTTPELWSTTDLFAQRQSVDFSLEADQYFPLGDNSPQSQDARSWSNRSSAHFEIPRYVDRKLLIGKALLIYWPHAWNSPVPFTPNVQRMGVIK